MNRVFVGVSGEGGCEVYVEQDGRRHRLTRRTGRTHESYCWNGIGPDSTELARAILWIVRGNEPPWSLYKGFASDVVTRFPAPSACESDCWRLREEEVVAWLRDVGWSRSEEHEQSRNAFRAGQPERRPRTQRSYRPERRKEEGPA